jgi:hypothetical protein
MLGIAKEYDARAGYRPMALWPTSVPHDERKTGEEPAACPNAAPLAV